ncbi:hypothetical protein [Chitinophaga sancti]|uniref:Uncharacterized protein n=1 Tax=Chitinophaga sancti TaxID=1004 RepID=A0ABZ0XNV7_9BACT|nr:hypothetical protein [Chitinophaga sancti]WQD62589.1 hypothetical protein U0033_32355 [Chitinophaga sancti]WQG91842.1 hypothetical protein SR876_10030 [Chitinophaga sancti]
MPIDKFQLFYPVLRLIYQARYINSGIAIGIFSVKRLLKSFLCICCAGVTFDNNCRISFKGQTILPVTIKADLSLICINHF